MLACLLDSFQTLVILTIVDGLFKAQDNWQTIKIWWQEGIIRDKYVTKKTIDSLCMGEM